MSMCAASPERKQKLAIWGASGHAMVVADIVRLRGEYEIVGYLDDVNSERRNVAFAGSQVLGGREQLDVLRAAGVHNIIIGIGDCEARLKLSALVSELEFRLATAIHPRATVAHNTTIGAGTVIAAGAIVNPGSQIGENVIINTCASIDHENVIGDGAHIGPGAHLGGLVTVGRGTWVGIGATIRDRVVVGANSIVGAGAVLLEDLPDGVVAYGVPAKIQRKLQVIPSGRS